MKYLSLPSFQKHIQSAAPDHLSKIYLILVADDFERAKAVDLLLRVLSGFITRLEGNKLTASVFLDATSSMSFLGESIVVVDEIDKVGKKELENFLPHLSPPSGYVILAARSKMAGLSQLVEKEGVVLDLLAEKPWDKEKRLTSELIERAAQAGKKVGMDLIRLLLDRLGTDVSLLENEMDKLICYTGDRSFITQEDVLAISSMSNRATLWQIAERAVWEQEGLESIDAQDFHPLVYALRSQLHIGLTLATLIEEKRPSEEWGPFLPKLFTKTLEKRSSQAAHLTSSYFKKGLKALFEVELQARSEGASIEALLSAFQSQIRKG